MTSKRQSFGKDTGLQARMAVTLFLLGLIYVILIAVLIAAGIGAALIAVIAAGLFLVQLTSSDRIALASMGAREVTPAQQPELHAIIDRLCVQADLPKPRVCVMASNMPNAFAMGRSQKAATVCATSGLLAMLGPSELEAVMAHEMTHILNRDVMVMTLASFFASIAAFITQFGFFFGGGFGGGGNNNNNDDDFGLVILVSVVVYALSFLLLRTLSRYREFSADRGSAILTGHPSALASALLTIDRTMKSGAVPSRDLRAAEGMSAFFIMPARAKASLMNIFADHPPLEARLAHLRKLETQLQGAS
jgi:heat shock protein HtpX